MHLYIIYIFIYNNLHSKENLTPSCTVAPTRGVMKTGGMCWGTSSSSLFFLSRSSSWVGREEERSKSSSEVCSGRASVCTLASEGEVLLLVYVFRICQENSYYLIASMENSYYLIVSMENS